MNAQSFENAILDTQKDFIPHLIKFYQSKNNKQTINWSFYEDKIVEPYRRLKKQFFNYQIEFFDECKWIDFKKLINTESYKVIILFSHCINNGNKNESIEFFDRLISSENVFSEILDVNRIYDFSVCKPSHLKNLMKSNFSHVTIGTSAEYIPVIFWFYIYAELFTTMELEKVEFLEAMYLTKRKYRQYKIKDDE